LAFWLTGVCKTLYHIVILFSFENKRLKQISVAFLTVRRHYCFLSSGITRYYHTHSADNFV